MSTNTRPTPHLTDGTRPIPSLEGCHASGRVGSPEPLGAKPTPASCGRVRMLPRFLRSRRAAGTALTAALFTLMSLAGIAFASDHVWLVYQRDLLKVASDAASVAVTKAMKTLDPSLKKDAVTAALLPTAKRYILANVPEGSRKQVADSLAVTIEPNRAAGTVYLTATANLGGVIFGTWLWGAVVSETQVQSGTERIDSGGGLIEVALAIDTTGSMLDCLSREPCGDPHDSGYYDAPLLAINIVKEVAGEMVDTLVAGSDTVAVGVVPWHYRVKFDQTTRTRLKDNGWAQYPQQQHYPNPDDGNRPAESYTLPTSMPETWEGCVDQRLTSGQNPPGLTAVLPTVTPLTMAFYSPTVPNEYKTSRWNLSIAFTCYPNQAYCYDPAKKGEYRGKKKKDDDGQLILKDGSSIPRFWWEPQADCYDSISPILPLTADTKKAKERINALEAKGDATYSTLGLIWGHRLLAPTWRNTWGDPVHPINLSQREGAQKALVLLTDGKDNVYEERTARKHRETACAAAKDDGIKVFVIAALEGFDAANTWEFRESLKKCSSTDTQKDPDGQYFFFYQNVTPENLREAFRSIGQHLTRFRRVL